MNEDASSRLILKMSFTFKRFVSKLNQSKLPNLLMKKKQVKVCEVDDQ